MKVRHKTLGAIGYSDQFNVHAVSEIIVGFVDGDCTTDYITNYDVELHHSEWKDLGQAFRDRDVIPNNYNTHFGLPVNDEARQRGYNP